MEQMRQGAGIIDVVNNYLQIALPYGAIGLLLFVGVFASALSGVRRVRSHVLQQPEAERLGRALIAALIGMLVTIGTVSNIGVISTMYSLITGICVSYIRTFQIQKTSPKRLVARRPPTKAPTTQTKSQQKQARINA